MKKLWFTLLILFVAVLPAYASDVPDLSKLPEVISVPSETEELLGCEAVIDKKGNVTKHYWPKLG